MTGLEIALFILGTAFIIISFFIVDNTDRSPKAALTGALDADAFEQMRTDIIEKTTREADIILHETEDKLEAISNDKIIAVGEYSDQILEKIGSNHKEVVFLYQMLNEKEEELKGAVTKMDNTRIECEKLAKQIKEAEERRAAARAEAQQQAAAKSAAIAAQAVQADRPAVRVANTQASEVLKYTDDDVPTAGESSTENITEETPKPVVKRPATRPQAVSQARTQTTAARTQTGTTQRRTKTVVASTQAISTPVQIINRDTGSLSRNDEIIALHKSGKSVMEISKLLGMGQGEVKLIIDLYC